MGPERARERAEEVALEQTVEVPRSAVRDSVVEKESLGQVESVEVAPDGALARLAYPVETTGFDPAQLLNVIFGNSSLAPDVECLDVELPGSLLATLGGPRLGLPGLREVVGVRGRPLTCTAIKPMGLSTGALADLLRTFARAGIDVIKDDHGLADQSWSRYEERVRACLAAAAEVADETGHHAVYVPNLIGSPRVVQDALRFAQDAGARAVMVAPMLVGLPTFWELCRVHAEVPVLAHPAFGGSLRIAHATLFGKLFRLFGADAVIFLHFASRFRPEPAECRELTGRLLRPWGDLLPSLPVPAGGIEAEGVAEVVRFYGNDSMLLVGGSLQREPGAVFERSRFFVETVREAAAGLGPES